MVAVVNLVATQAEVGEISRDGIGIEVETYIYLYSVKDPLFDGEMTMTVCKLCCKLGDSGHVKGKELYSAHCVESKAIFHLDFLHIFVCENIKETRW